MTENDSSRRVVRDAAETILVTGGAGFIGSNFVRFALRNTEARVVVFDKLTYAGSLLNLKDVENDPRYAFVKGDIGYRTAVKNALELYQPTSIVHFAAETHVDRSIDGPETFWTPTSSGPSSCWRRPSPITERPAINPTPSGSCTSRLTRCTAAWARKAGFAKTRTTSPIRRTPRPRLRPTTSRAPTTRLSNCRF